jgi:predicted small lipoprotein YifL
MLFKGFAMKRLSLALIAFACLLAGCGQKGDLYLPDDEKAAHEHRHDTF